MLDELRAGRSAPGRGRLPSTRAGGDESSAATRRASSSDEGALGITVEAEGDGGQAEGVGEGLGEVPDGAGAALGDERGEGLFRCSSLSGGLNWPSIAIADSSTAATSSTGRLKIRATYFESPRRIRAKKADLNNSSLCFVELIQQPALCCV